PDRKRDDARGGRLLGADWHDEGAGEEEHEEDDEARPGGDALAHIGAEGADGEADREQQRDFREKTALAEIDTWIVHILSAFFGIWKRGAPLPERTGLPCSGRRLTWT